MNASGVGRMAGSSRRPRHFDRLRSRPVHGLFQPLAGVGVHVRLSQGGVLVGLRTYGIGAVIPNLSEYVLIAFFLSLGYLFLLVLLEILLRKQLLAVVVLLLVLDGPYLASPEVWVRLPMNLLIDAAVLFLLFRSGLLSCIVAISIVSVFFYPMTFDTSAWFSSIRYAYLGVVAAITLYGFRTSLGGRPLVNLSRFEQ